MRMDFKRRMWPISATSFKHIAKPGCGQKAVHRPALQQRTQLGAKRFFLCCQLEPHSLSPSLNAPERERGVIALSDTPEARN
jgi:hypothetical protein